MSFEESTHKKHWLFTSAELDATRREVHEEAVQRIQQIWKDYDASRAVASEDRPFVSLEEAQILLIFCEKKFSKVLTKQLGAPDKVVATALMYFKRFYVRRSVLDFHPEEVMQSCIVLAYKVEEVPITSTRLEREAALAYDTALQLEVEVLDALRFHLVVFHPFHPLAGFVHMLHEVDGETNFAPLQEAAHGLVLELLSTDLPLMFAPSRLALLALREAGAEVAVNVAGFIQLYFTRTPGEQEEIQAALAQAADARDAEFGRLAPYNAKRLRELVFVINDKLNACRNPLRDVSHELFAHKQTASMFQSFRSGAAAMDTS